MKKRYYIPYIGSALIIYDRLKHRKNLGVWERIDGNIEIATTFVIISVFNFSLILIHNILVVSGAL